MRWTATTCSMPPAPELLRDLGQPEEARAADQRALDLTSNPAEQAILRQRLSWA